MTAFHLTGGQAHDLLDADEFLSLITLDVKGESWSTEKLAEKLRQFQTMGKSLDLLIGGADGLSEACLKKASHQWSLSPLTFPHALVRILVIEQLYRAISILQGHPYHRF